MKKHFISMAVTATILASCGGAKTTTAEADKFDYTVEQFADLQYVTTVVRKKLFVSAY